MLRRFRVKTLQLPALIHGERSQKALNPSAVRPLKHFSSLPNAEDGRRRRRSFSEVASNFPFANAGEGFQTRCSAGTNNSVMSSSETRFNKGHWENVHPAMASSKQTLAFPRNRAGVVENLKPSLPDSIEDDDDFKELGPCRQHSVDLGYDMAKEKCKDKPLSLPSDNESHRDIRNHMDQSLWRKSNSSYPMKQDNCYRDINSNQINQNHISRTKSEAKKQNHAVEYNQNHRTISIDKVPPYISLQNLKEAVTVYGEILSASLTTGPDSLTSCHVEFKSPESKERVLAAPRITVRNCQLPVRDLYIPKYITIRIGNISMETAEPAIHSMCMSCGDVAGLARTKEGAVDVAFKVKDNLVAQGILRRLNDIYYDDCRWSAQLAPIPGQKSRTDPSGSQWSVGSQINNLMETFQKQFQMQRIYLEDLENLHYAVLHLRDRPADTNAQVPDSELQKKEGI